MTHRAAIYCRISLDRTGEAIGVDRQEKLCRKLARDRGWGIAEVYVDNDVSAFSGKRRPKYEEMLAAVDEGHVDAIIAIDQDRLARRMGGLDELLRLCERQGVPIVLHSGEIDTTTADGIFKAQILGAVAESESRKNSMRVKRQREHAALAGKPGAGRRVFGYQVDRVTIDGTEAPLVREAVKRFLAGESPGAIATDWNARGIRTSTGGEWSRPSMKGMLGNPRYAQLVEREGSIVEGVKGQWPRLITRKQHERAVAALSRGRQGPRGRPPAALLSGIARCGKCGAGMHSSRTRDGRRYQCPSSPGRSGCGGVVISADTLDNIITEAILHRVDTTRLARAAKPKSKKDAGGDDLGEIESRLAELADMFALGEISRGEWTRARVGLNDRRERALQTLQAATESTALRPFAGRKGVLRAAWPEMTAEQRRGVVSAVIEQIEVAPATSFGPTLDPKRLDVRWAA